MNTMKLLIGATAALLITGIVLSYKTMKEREITDPLAAEIARLEQYEKDLTAKLEEITHKNPDTSGNRLQLDQPVSAAESLQNASEVESMKKTLERTQQEIEELRKKAAKAEEKATLADNEAGALAAEVMDKREPETARANSIVQALLMARISTYDADAKMASIFLERPDDIVTGMVLGIRRNSGIVGRVKVGTIENTNAIADPIPGSFFGGNIDIQEGDELIVPPAF